MDLLVYPATAVVTQNAVVVPDILLAHTTRVEYRQRPEGQGPRHGVVVSRNPSLVIQVIQSNPK
jgi:hypothetical protein